MSFFNWLVSKRAAPRSTVLPSDGLSVPSLHATPPKAPLTAPESDLKARRQERRDGLARFPQACLADDEIGMLENERWCDVDALYDRCESWEDYMERRYPDIDSDY